MNDVLPLFGPHKDAMLSDNWHLAHSMLSPYLNTGLLLPGEVCDAAEEAYDQGRVPIASAEGFIRQVIGWREYVWALYWRWMPDYRDENVLGATRDIPAAFMSTGATKMRCVAACVEDMEQRGWAHHIQRLMVLGNFALIAGVEPRQLTDWMWERFVDGAEWVMVPNVVGMALYADGGRMSTGTSRFNHLPRGLAGCHQRSTGVASLGPSVVADDEQLLAMKLARGQGVAGRVNSWATVAAKPLSGPR